MSIASSELTQRAFRQDDRSGFFQLLRDKGILVRVVVLEEDRAQRGWHSPGVNLILENDRNTVKWTGQTGGFECGIESVGFFESLRIDRNDRIDRWSLLVICLDAIQVELNQLVRGEPS